MCYERVCCDRMCYAREGYEEWLMTGRVSFATVSCMGHHQHKG